MVKKKQPSADERSDQAKQLINLVIEFDRAVQQGQRVVDELRAMIAKLDKGDKNAEG